MPFFGENDLHNNFNPDDEKKLLNIINAYDEKDEPSTPLIYKNMNDTTNIKNIILIDSRVADKQIFFDSVNINTFPIIYYYNSDKNELLSLLRKNFQSGLKRISFVFHDGGKNFQIPFLNNKVLFQETDLENNKFSDFSDNISLVMNIINEFKVGNLDFMACNTLQYSNWKQYYDLLKTHTSVIVGASTDKTGNLKYGGNWVMENTNENIRDMYFNNTISNYASTLAPTTISTDGATSSIWLGMNDTKIKYSTTSSSGPWIDIQGEDWNVIIVNTNPTLNSILNVIFTEDLTISSTYGNTLGFFSTGSSYITFDGAGFKININNITDYLGLIHNGSTATGTAGYSNVVVQNINSNVTGGSLSIAVNTRAGWICASSFGRGAAENYILNCTNNGDIYSFGGGISGERVAVAGGNVIIDDCHNSGTISEQGGGGIVGLRAGNSGTITIRNCTNSGEISGREAGGISGQQAGQDGTATFTNCTNSGEVSGEGAGGISGQFTGLRGLVTFTNCTNSGEVSGGNAGGISGQQSGQSGTLNMNNCYSIGNISGNSAGGLLGTYSGAYGLSLTIDNCYSTGIISGSLAGGILGASFGVYSNSSDFTIQNCYSTGTIATTSGGIVGGNAYTSYPGPPILNIINCYSYGTYVDTNSGIIAANFNYNTNQQNCYTANGTWSDTDANLNLDNSNDTWLIYDLTKPWLLISFNNTIYNPNSLDLIYGTAGTSEPGLFTPEYQYIILQPNPYLTITIDPDNGVLNFPDTLSAQEYIISVLVGKINDSTSIYSDYNINSYTLTVNKESQTITFGPLQQITITTGIVSYITLNKNSSAGLTIIYDSSNINVATITGNIINVIGGGNSVITASQPGNTNYFPATNVNQTLVAINPAATYQGLYDRNYNQTYNQIYNQIYNQLYNQLCNSIPGSSCGPLPPITFCYPINYTKLNSLTWSNSTFNELYINEYEFLYKTLYDTYYNPHYVTIYNELYGNLFINLYNELIEDIYYSYTSQDSCSNITLDTNSFVYVLYIELKTQLEGQLYNQLYDQLYTQLKKSLPLPK